MQRKTPVITKNRLRKMVLVQHQIICDLKAERSSLKAQIANLENELDRSTGGAWRTRTPWYKRILKYIVALFKPHKVGQ